MSKKKAQNGYENIAKWLTKSVTPHEVVSNILRICSCHLPRNRMESSEVVTMETVIVLKPAKGRCAVWQVCPHLLLNCLCLDVKAVSFIS